MKTAASLFFSTYMLLLGMPSLAQEAKIDAPNIVPITALLTSSGQPSADALGKLGQAGYKAVVYLAPSTVPDAVKDEAEILKQQGIEFLNIPIDFGKPTPEDFERFAAFLQGHTDKKVLVHCQINMRGSSMVFLYRVLINKEAPEKAYEAVIKVWSPSGVWKKFITTQLRKNAIAFQLY